jgi:tRNA (mo5U34)-methyltransferase
MENVDSQYLATMANQIRWFHRIPLGDGYFTLGVKDLAQEMQLWRFPTDLTGKTVLDIGCNDGGYSLAALERGANRVVAIDAFMTPGLQFVRQHLPLGRRIEYVSLDIFSEIFLELPPFDVTLFMGVLYHLKNPLAGLVRLRRVTRQLALIETFVDERVENLPAMVFFEGDELDGNKTNWWGPNLACFQAMVRAAGFTRVELTHHAVDPQTQQGRAAVLAYVEEEASRRFDLETLWTVNPKKYSA